MNKSRLNDLFNPMKYIAPKQDEKRTMLEIDALKSLECPKSKDKTCANAECPHNLLKYNYFE